MKYKITGNAGNKWLAQERQVVAETIYHLVLAMNGFGMMTEGAEYDMSDLENLTCTLRDEIDELDKALAAWELKKNGPEIH